MRPGSLTSGTFLAVFLIEAVTGIYWPATKEFNYRLPERQTGTPAARRRESATQQDRNLAHQKRREPDCQRRTHIQRQNTQDREQQNTERKREKKNKRGNNTPHNPQHILDIRLLL
jgi:hypothetical protein